MLHRIESSRLALTVSTLGAEMQRLTSPEGLEYLCTPERSNWDGKAPVLFPITGAVNGPTVINGQEYTFTQHGFARNSEFTVTGKTDSRIALQLSWNAETLVTYPFKFVFTVVYEIRDNLLNVTSIVKNEDKRNMLYSV